MKGRLNKLFRKNKCVRVFYIDEVRHLSEHWVIPDYGQVTIDKHRFYLTDPEQILSKNVPTYILNANNTEPVQVLTKSQSRLSPKDFDTAVSAHVAREIFETVGGRIDKGMIAIIISVLTLIVAGVAVYFLMNNMPAIIDKLDRIDQILRNIGGVA